MVDIVWPADLVPYKVLFYLQPHVGGTESPLTRTRKVYGLSAPRWVARLTFRGGYDGAPRLWDADGYGPRLDALLAELEGGLNNAVFHDFRRPVPLVRQSIVSSLKAAADVGKGATEMQVSGFSPNTAAFGFGDPLGGDGRPHIVTGGAITGGAGTVFANAAGVATVRFKPPLSAAIAAGTVLKWPVTGRFQLTSEDAAASEATINQPVEYTLDFIEDLS